MGSLLTFILIGAIFSPLAGAMAFLITYEEYKHHYIDKKEPIRASLRASAFAFLVFMLISLLIGFTLSYFRFYLL